MGSNLRSLGRYRNDLSRDPRAVMPMCCAVGDVVVVGAGQAGLAPRLLPAQGTSSFLNPGCEQQGWTILGLQVGVAPLVQPGALLTPARATVPHGPLELPRPPRAQIEEPRAYGRFRGVCNK
jgi:hypothetical protein